MPRVLSDTLALFVVLGLVGLLFWVATAFAGRFGGMPVRGVPTRFAHSLVPIALGYVVAHSYSFLVVAIVTGHVRGVGLAHDRGSGCSRAVLFAA